MFKSSKIKTMFDEDDPKLVFYLDGKSVHMEEVYKDNEDLIERSIKNHKNQIAESALTYCLDLNRVNDKAQTYLMLSIAFNNYDVFKKLIDMDINLNLADNNKESALFYAVRNPNRDFFDNLIKKDMELNLVNFKGENLATFAYLYDRKDMAEYFVRSGVDINQADNEGNTLLHYALKKYDTEFAGSLIDYGADIFLENQLGQTGYEIASENGIVDVVINKMHEIIDELFEEENDEVLLKMLNEYQDVRDYSQFNIPFLIAKFAIKHNNKLIFDKIIRNQGMINSVDYRGKSLLMYCIELGRFVLARKIIYIGGDLNLRDNENKTILFIVMEKMNNEDNDEDTDEEFKVIFRELLEWRVDVNIRDSSGNTLLMNAILNKQTDLIDRLINYKYIDLNVRDDSGKTALLLAYEQDDLATVIKIANSHKANIDILDFENKSLLLLTLLKDNFDLFTALLQSGASLDLQYEDGLTILMVAIKLQKIKYVAKIFEYPFETDIQDDFGMTALMHAIRIRNAKIVEALLRCGASTAITDKNGDTPILYAVDQEAFDIAKLLREFADNVPAGGNDE